MRFAVIGDPIAHSKSPAMHVAAFRALGFEHTYEGVRVTADELAGIVAALRNGTWDGLNVTIPHKRSVLAMVDEVDSSASMVGAANTLVRREGRVIAYNTDVPALAEELRALGADVDWANAHGLVIGSGGAARAAIVALAVHLEVARVVVRARRDAVALAREMTDLVARAGGAATISGEPLSPASTSDARFSAIVQCTSAGMTGADPGDAVARAVAWDSLDPATIALDVVYSPPQTPFLRASAARGLRSANGLGMLARQGAIAERHWLGVEPPLDVLLRASSP
jgi:shikimate dehydrogenase